MWEVIENEILPFVDKPARYIGGEKNTIVKKHDGKTTIALIYPDVYEIGISNIGLKILYNILNNEKNIVCERAYAPWPDMEDQLRKKRLPLFSLESKTPLSEFDVLGFSFQYELLYTNFLNILDLSKIPLYSKERTAGYPFIIGGGPAAVNIEPLAYFLDAVCVGDGESRILKIVEAILEGKRRGFERVRILEGLSAIEGIYVPSMYVEKEENGFVIPVGRKVTRYIERDLENLEFTTAQILPNIQAVQDRAVLEVSRGCGRGCRFCQAGISYRPVRERSVPTLLKLAREIIRKTGYREISLLSLSISDYSNLNSLVNAFDVQMSGHGISFSLPSLRIDTFTLELAIRVKEIRKSGLTFAIEGGTQDLRDFINKNVNEEDLYNVIKIACDLGWRKIKLYFMIGLCPLEKGLEVKSIADLALKLDSLIKGGKLQITLSVALFIPRPYTPFQWNAQMDKQSAFDDFHELIERLKKKKNIIIKYHNPDMGELEGIMARGDRKISRVIETAFREGARYDGWSDSFRPEIWKEAFNKNNIDPSIYLKEKNISSSLPWEAIDIGINKRYLLNERNKALERKMTEDCSSNCNNVCGVCDFKKTRPRFTDKTGIETITFDKKFLNGVLIKNESHFICRFLYSKTGSMKYIGPIDLEELFERTFIRANLPVVFTRGYNPHIRVEMGWALPIGFSSLYEVAEMELSKGLPLGKLIRDINSELPAGIKIIKIKIIKMPFPKFTKLCREHFTRFSFIAGLLKNEILSKAESIGYFTKRGSKVERVINLKDYLTGIALINNRIRITFLHREGGARIRDYITYLTGYDSRQMVVLDPLVETRFVTEGGNITKLFDLMGKN